MTDKKETKRLMKFAKRILEKKSLKNLKKVEQEDKIGAIKYLMKARLEREYDYLKERTESMKHKGSDVFFIETKLSLLGSKIKLFNVTHHKDDFINMANLFKQVQKEAENV
ncbi:hypothetical protein A3K73_05050 [Candidatus Pacearchaeota archaeon RBG_13_36_9]|nr:MAG: hypothetical protein A3K73_05050 [Candidatus Pacearchaeota archaeon RBG_13_36_9]